MNRKQQARNCVTSLRLYKFFAALLLVLALIGCAGLTQNALVINGILFRNQTADTLHDVRILVNRTGAFAHCSHVFPGNECSTTFRSKPYLGNPVIIQWVQDGIEHSTGELQAALPANAEPGLQLRVHVVIASNGVVSVSLVP